MTFSIIARCPGTGKVGICIATGSPSVGGRGVIYAESGVGAMALQATAEARLGRAAFKTMADGLAPQEVIDKACAADPNHEWRQIGVVDAKGKAAARTGSKARHWAGHFVGEQFVVLCNRVADESVMAAIAATYARAAEAKFEERLMRAIEAGRDAGGQVDGQTSAAILTYAGLPVPYVDLRVDLAEEPVAELRRILDWHEPLLDYYQERLDNPELPLHKDWLKERNIKRQFGQPQPKKA
jgi:uncharacterized Ntn-hydrolase superfamily protein